MSGAGEPEPIPPYWFDSRRLALRVLWRGVEAQHRVATLRLVDSLAEQALLEDLLEAAKPPVPPQARGTHYLVFTPFRYQSPWPSRFRRAGEPGLWYGADSPATAVAELAHWRLRFVRESQAFDQRAVITEHTLFRARFAGVELDLTAPPWNALQDRWRDARDHRPCQALADQARQVTDPSVAAIRYASARRADGWCHAVLDAASLTLDDPLVQQTWVCKATRDEVMFVHEREAWAFTEPEV